MFLCGKGVSILAVILALVLTLLSLPAMPAYAYEDAKVNEVTQEAGKYIAETVKKPAVGSIGGEWAVIGLARSGYAVPQTYFEDYYNGVEEYVKNCQGVLHERKYTEYSRVILALTAIGRDPANVGGYNLLTPLGDYDATVWQGLNGPIWALIAWIAAIMPCRKIRRPKRRPAGKCTCRLFWMRSWPTAAGLSPARRPPPPTWI